MRCRQPLGCRTWAVWVIVGLGVSALRAQPASSPERVVDAQANPIVLVQPEVPTRLLLRRGVSAVLVARGRISRFVLGDPQIVAVNVLTERELVVNAKGEGTTNLLLWEERAGQTFAATFWVEVVPMRKEEPPPPRPQPPDPARLQALLVEALKGLAIEPTVLLLPDGSVAVVLRGEVATGEEAKAAEALATLVAPKVINLLRVRAAPSVSLSPEELKALRLEAAIGIPGVRVTLVDDKIVLHGTVNSLLERQVAEERAKPFGTVVNRLEVAEPKIRQFVTEVKVLEVSRNALQRLGIIVGSVTATVGGQVGQQTPIFSVEPGKVILGEPGTPDRPIARVTALGAQLDALVQSGAARLLAHPQQRTIEGADATFLVGGLVPIPIFGFFGVGGGAAAPGAATVVFFPFGITLTLHPEATLKGEIFLQMRVEVTSPDFGLAAQVLGTTVPGFRFRGLEDVRLLLRDGDTVVISGLIQDDLREQVSRVPLLSRIPILGELFKSREFVRQQTELVLVVTVRTEEVPVSPEALQLLRNYQKRPILPRPSFVAPLGGGLGGLSGGIGGVGGMPAAPTPPTPAQ